MKVPHGFDGYEALEMEERLRERQRRAVFSYACTSEEEWTAAPRVPRLRREIERHAAECAFCRLRLRVEQMVWRARRIHLVAFWLLMLLMAAMALLNGLLLVHNLVGGRPGAAMLNVAGVLVVVLAAGASWRAHRRFEGSDD